METRLTKGVGGLSLLGVQTDGIFYAKRLDNVEMKIDRTIHLMSAEGDQIGIAREPISERYVHVSHSLAIGPDESVYNLIGRQETVDVIRLFFVERISPLNSLFIEPRVTKSQDDP